MTTWPRPSKRADKSTQAEFAKALYAGKVEAEVAHRAWEDTERTRLDADTLARNQAAWAAEYALEKSIHDARIEVAKGAIDRSQAGAEFIRNAAAGIATIYAAVLGLTYGAADRMQAAPARAVIPAVFLGAALVGAAAYVAFLTRGSTVPAPNANQSLRVYQENRVNTFVQWVALYAYRRAYCLHAAVLALAFGVAFLPIAYIDWTGPTVIWVPAGCLAATLALPIFTRPK